MIDAFSQRRFVTGAVEARDGGKLIFVVGDQRHKSDGEYVLRTEGMLPVFCLEHVRLQLATDLANKGDLVRNAHLLDDAFKPS